MTVLDRPSLPGRSTACRLRLRRGCVALVLTAAALDAHATLYCGRTYTELAANAARPFNAVGYINNGCTAFLIDGSHIMAAGHCFVDTTTGQWQTGLRFYPNFHPSRVATDPAHVPRADITRAVVGSRAAESVLGTGMDWAIARVENWRDVGSLDLTPVALAPSVPALGTALQNPAYNRHHFPYDDHDTITWDNMEWDSTQCSWVGANHGMWAIKMHSPPLFNGTSSDIVGCNSRWASGMMHGSCTLNAVNNDVVLHDCDSAGGSSGSPLMVQDPTRGWQVVGVAHGSPQDFSVLVPTCTTRTAATATDNGGPSVERFRFAPRFASNVAVHRRPDNPSATMVFAVDSDSNRVVARNRVGAVPTYAGSFNYWQDLGTPASGATLSRVAACSADTSARPQVFVIVNQNAIFTRVATSATSWSAWSPFSKPAGATTLFDIDASADTKGDCLLFAATDKGVFVSAKPTSTVWDGWFTVAAGSFKVVTALNYQSTVVAAMLDTAGQVSWTGLGPAGWAVPTLIPTPTGVSAWRDIDMTWDEAARGFMVAVSTAPDNRLWFMPMYGTQAWTQWRFFDTHLWAPGAAAQDAPHLQSVTASRWMEDPAGTTSPVVFATDDSGNIYFIEFSRINPAGAGWVLDWKSFYHEKIAY